MGRSRADRLERLIEEVARGERDVSSIRDDELREAVRIALRLHSEAEAGPDGYTKARMRARIMGGLTPRPRSLRDNAWTILELLARPAPYLVRGIALGSLALCLALGGFVASADTLPDDLLYPVKIAAEQVRLALAGASEDRAAVELSIAEHRLLEAEKLAATGRTSDALVASAFYSQHIASAAAELAPQAESDLSSQLESRFSAQRDRALVLASSLALNVKSARASQVLAMIATSPLAPGSTRVERVAESAVTLAADLASAAEEASSPESAPRALPETTRAIETQRAPETQRVTETNRATASLRASATRAVEAPRPTLSETPRTERPFVLENAHPTLVPASTRDPRASDAAKATREAATKAKAAAEKLRKALQQKNAKDHKGN